MLIKKMIIIADDLGLHPTINDGIILSLKNKWIDGASIMTNGESFLDAVEKLKNSKANIGIHFVLVEEKGIVLKKLPKNHKTFLIQYILGLISIENIEKEMRSQFEVCKLSGINPTFINSHQHLHLLPKITDISIKLAKENNVPYIRTVSEPLSLKAGLYRALQSIILRFLSRIAKVKIKKAGLETSDLFVGFLNAGNMQKNDIDFAAKISKSNNISVEVGCHPGHESVDLKEKYKHWGSYNWRKELKILSDFASQK